MNLFIFTSKIRKPSFVENLHLWKHKVTEERVSHTDAEFTNCNKLKALDIHILLLEKCYAHNSKDNVSQEPFRFSRTEKLGPQADKAKMSHIPLRTD